MDAARMLAAIPLFDDLSQEDINALASALKSAKYKPGDVVFEKGEVGDSMFLVADGSVSIRLGDRNAKVVLKEIHVGQYFGELALFDTKPRSATAIAEGECELLELERDTLHAQMAKRPKIALAIISEMAERLRETNEMISARAAKDVNKEIDAKMGFGERIADRVAEVAGSWTFILSFLAVLFTWTIYNTAAIAKAISGGEPFDPFPYIFFNLLLSIVAAFQGPVIMMSQNRQSIKDRAQAETDFQVNLKNEIGIESLQRGLAEVKAHLLLLERGMTPVSARNPGGSTAASPTS